MSYEVFNVNNGISDGGVFGNERLLLCSKVLRICFSLCGIMNRFGVEVSAGRRVFSIINYML